MPLSQFTIQATSKGTNLPGWILTPNDKVLIRWIGGSWTSLPLVAYPMHDANGAPGSNAASSYLQPGAQEGALIACTGNPAVSKWTIGNYGIISIDLKSAGQLWVAINDDWSNALGPGYADNKGSITIQVTHLEQYLSELKKENEMQEFIEHFGHSIGVTSVDTLKSVISNNKEQLLSISTSPNINSIGQVPEV